MGTPDIAEKILTAIAHKEAKAMVADSTAYDDAGDPVTAAGSFSWHVEVDSLSKWVQDGAGENVALASDVDMSMEDWTKMTDGRVEFIADNDPASVLRRCAADRKILARHTKTACRGLHGDTPHQPECFDCWRDGDEWPCADLRDLADGYGVTP